MLVPTCPVLYGAVIALHEQRIRIRQLDWNQCSLELLGKSRDSVARILGDHG